MCLFALKEAFIVYIWKKMNLFKDIFFYQPAELFLSFSQQVEEKKYLFQ